MKKFTAAFILLAMLFAGCATQNSSVSSTAPDPGNGDHAAIEQPVAVYMDFDDILIPSDLALNKDESFVFKFDQFKIAVQKFEGRVDADSLFVFFKNNMQKDNWMLKDYEKSIRSQMNFEKPHKVCRITINDGTYNTKVFMIVVEQVGNAGFGSKSQPSSGFSEGELPQ